MGSSKAGMCNRSLPQYQNSGLQSQRAAEAKREKITNGKPSTEEIQIPRRTLPENIKFSNKAEKPIGEPSLQATGDRKTSNRPHRISYFLTLAGWWNRERPERQKRGTDRIKKRGWGGGGGTRCAQTPGDGSPIVYWWQFAHGKDEKGAGAVSKEKAPCVLRPRQNEGFSIAP